MLVIPAREQDQQAVYASSNQMNKESPGLAASAPLFHDSTCRGVERRREFDCRCPTKPSSLPGRAFQFRWSRAGFPPARPQLHVDADAEARHWALHGHFRETSSNVVLLESKTRLRIPGGADGSPSCDCNRRFRERDA